MQIEKFNDSWLFQEHSKKQIKTWVAQLRYFYFVRAWGGHNNDRDRFAVRFSYDSKDDLLDKLRNLGIEPSILPDDTPRPIPGVSYPSEEFLKFKIFVHRFPDIEQPGSTFIHSLPCNIYIDDSAYEISVSGSKDGNDYRVTNEDFEISKLLESVFDQLNLESDKDLEMEKNGGCVSRRKYPELFE
jgi:hypothetical protein